jgi:hypothetical protein
VNLLVRAEHMRVTVEPVDGGDWFAGEVIERSFLGATSRLYVRAQGSDRVLIADVSGTPLWAKPAARVHVGWASDDGLAYSPDRSPPGNAPS